MPEHVRKARKQRYAHCTHDDVAVYASIIEESVADLRAVAERMGSHRVETFRMDGAAKFSRGHKLLSEFVGHLEVALAQALADARSARQQQEVDKGGEGG
tara:strand:+ start:291 stop:590 length:300 start_codon:yes stop_codon:yes gene_type:complete